MNQLDPILSVNDVAEYFKTSRSTVFRWIKSGKLKSFMVGGQRRVKKEWLLEYENELIAESA